MAGAFVQKFGVEAVAAQSGGTPLSTASTAVTGGNTLTVFVSYSNQLGAAESVSDGVNTFTAQGVRSTGALIEQRFVAANITGGTRAISFLTTDGNNVRGIAVVESSGAATSNPTDGTMKSNVQAAPTTATDATTSGTSLAVVGAGLCIAHSIDSGAGVAAPASGTGFTDRGTIWTGTTIPSRLETKSYASGNQTALFTALNNNEHTTSIVLLKDAGVGGGLLNPFRRDSFSGGMQTLTGGMRG